MAHEITSTDSAIFQGTRAWHGLGYVVEEELGPLAAVERAGLDWYVHTTNGVYGYTKNGEKIADSKKCFTYREDNNDILGYVSQGYNVFQNYQLAELAMSVSESASVESAFSMSGGKRVVILLKGGSIQAGRYGNDVLDDYFALVNGHDGTFSLRAFGTSVRIVCQNTLQMALSNAKSQTYSISHNGDFNSKLASMREALSEYSKTRDWFADTVNSLANKGVNDAMLNSFWRESFGIITDPKILSDKDKAIKESLKFVENAKVTFEQERYEKGMYPSMWLAANAVTSYVQHKTGARGRKTSYENRAGDLLMGKKNDTTNKVMKAALAFS